MNIFDLVLSEYEVNLDVGRAEERGILPADRRRGVAELEAGVLYPSTSIGLIALLAGGMVNFYSIKKYVGEHTETRDSLPRPQRISVGIGLVATLVSLSAGLYFILLG